MRKIFTFLLLFFFAQQYLTAQTVTSTTVNFKELAAYEAAHPDLVKHCATCPKKEADAHEGSNEAWEGIDNPNMPIPSGGNIKKQNSKDGVVPSPIRMGPSRLPAQQWLGHIDQGATIPPDTHGAVGLNHVITATNDFIKIQAKAGGAQVSQVSISTFTGIGNSCDPYMTFDPTAQRWIFSAIECTTNGNRVILMSSNTSDPTGLWRRITWVPASADGSLLLDHPYLGFDATKIVVSGRKFPSGFTGPILFLFDKAAMYAGTTMTFGINAQTIEKTAADGDAPLPVTVYDPPFSNVGNPSPGTFYILQGWNGTTIRLTTVTGNIPAATWNTGTAVFPTSTLGAWNNGNIGNAAQQMVETRLLAVNDARISCGVMMNGKIWASHHITFPATGTPDRVAVQWWQIQGAPGATFGNVLQNGRIGGTAANTFKWFSSIAVNRQEDVLIGYTSSSSTSRVNSAYVTRQSNTAANTTDDENIYHAGEDRYWKDFSSGRARWGDYSHTSLDPVNNSLWTIQEYASTGAGTVPPDNNSRYGVWWAQVPATGPDLTINDVTAAEGNAGTTAFTFTVSLSAPAPVGGVTFDIATADGISGAGTDAATAPSDYITKTLTTQTIPAGSSTYSFTVNVNGDLVQELDETFFVNVTNITNANLIDGQGLGTITNDDTNPCSTPTITAPTVVQPTCTSSNGSITVNATGSGAFTVLEYSLNGGTYQSSNAFTNLAPGNYNITVRPRVQPACITSYASNPVVLAAAVAAQNLLVIANPGTNICSGDNTLLSVAETPGLPGTNLFNFPLTSANALITFNFKNNNAFAVSITDIASVCNYLGATATATVFYKPVAINGAPGAISAANGWNSFGTGTFTGTQAIQPFVSGLNLVIPPGATYGIAVSVSSAAGAAPLVYNNAQTNTTVSVNGCDLITGTNIGYAGAAAPAAPGITIRRFIGSVSFQPASTPVAGGTLLWSPAAGLSSTTANPVGASPLTTTTYTVTHNNGAGCIRQTNITINVTQRPAVAVQPVNTTVCENATATFTAVTTGFNTSLAWQVSTNGGATWANVPAAAPYSGVNTGTLTITPAAIALNNNQYRLAVGGSGNCTGVVVNSNAAVLKLTPAPAVTATAAATCGGVKGISGTKLKASSASASNFVWTPVTGLYSNASATIAYVAGTVVDSVYAAPANTTIYTATGISGTTGCAGSGSVTINYTPPAPGITPNPAVMCLGGAAVKLNSSSSTTTTVSFASGPIGIPIIDDSPGGTLPHTINVASIPAGATISKITVSLNLTHTYVGDMSINLKAPNGKILNIDRNLSATGNPGADFVNTVISSTGTARLSTGAQPFTGTFKADAINGVVTPGYSFADPTGYIANATGFSDLYSIPNGSWTMAMADNGAGDVGFFNSWTLTITYVEGVLTTPAVWTPITGLFSDAAATTAYVAGTAVDSVYAKPAVTTNYNATVSGYGAPTTSTFSNPAVININDAAPGAPYPATIAVSGLPTTGVFVKSVTLTGINHTFPSDVDIVLQSPDGTNVILMSDVGGGNALVNTTYTFDDAAAANLGTGANAAGTYKPTNIVGTLGIEPDNWPSPGPGAVAQPNPALALFNGNPNGTWKLFVVDDFGGDFGTISGGFNIVLSYLSSSGCTSPAATVTVTVNVPVSITTQPANAAVCTDKVTSFTTGTAGTSPAHNWMVSSNNGNTWTVLANGGVYSGVKTATLVITAPPLSMSGYLYKDSIQGSAPCGYVISGNARLTVNPLPTIIIAAAPYQKLFPGLRTTLSSTVSPAAQTGGYTWLRNGVAVSGANSSSLLVNVDGLGDYTLRVTDVNGCSNTSNLVSITDSVSGQVFIYPNPNSGQFQVRYYSIINNTGLPRGVNVYDARGKRVFTQAYSITAPYARMDVDLRRHGSGVYWIEVVDVIGNRLAMGRAEVLR